ncbi:unnamed protein product [Moneuplotes crassus]|uniref:Uncharacterized protein n=1 Tax=Euplotes crassus TaxID=5936 RepID=A0AAD1XUZ6_EUPCR|nr:unnamed protein product [Moneuplotes crassus]
MSSELLPPEISSFDEIITREKAVACKKVSIILSGSVMITIGSCLCNIMISKPPRSDHANI